MHGFDVGCRLVLDPGGLVSSPRMMDHWIKKVNCRRAYQYSILLSSVVVNLNNGLAMCGFFRTVQDQGQTSALFVEDWFFLWSYSTWIVLFRHDWRCLQVWNEILFLKWTISSNQRQLTKVKILAHLSKCFFYKENYCFLYEKRRWFVNFFIKIFKV